MFTALVDLEGKYILIKPLESIKLDESVTESLMQWCRTQLMYNMRNIRFLI